MLINNFKNIEIPKYVIIGAGPAGITLANELESQDKNVLLIEGGGTEITEKDQSRYTGKVFGDKYHDLDITRLRYFGGSSNHWGGNCAPLDRVDFKKWPIKKIDLDKFTTKTKNILNIEEKFIKYNDTFFKSFKLSSALESDVLFKEKYYEKIIQSKKIFLSLNTNLIRFISTDTDNFVNGLEKIINLKY